MPPPGHTLDVKSQNHSANLIPFIWNQEFHKNSIQLFSNNSLVWHEKILNPFNLKTFNYKWSWNHVWFFKNVIEFFSYKWIIPNIRIKSRFTTNSGKLTPYCACFGFQPTKIQHIMLSVLDNIKHGQWKQVLLKGQTQLKWNFGQQNLGKKTPSQA